MVVVGSYAVRVFNVFSPAQPIGALPPQTHLSVDSIILGGCVLVLLAAALGLFTSRRISQPLQEIRLGAERFAAGWFWPPPPVPHVGGMLRLRRMPPPL